MCLLASADGRTGVLRFVKEQVIINNILHALTMDLSREEPVVILEYLHNTFQPGYYSISKKFAKIFLDNQPCNC
jgi:hypothetical protein